MKFDDYIKSKLKDVLNDDKKQGKRRDVGLLTGILNALFWARSTPNRSVYDIPITLPPRYKEMKKDTLEDNLEFLSKVPTKEQFRKLFTILTEKQFEAKFGDQFNGEFINTSSEHPEVNIYSLNADIEPVSTVAFNKIGKPRKIYTLNSYYIIDYYEKQAGSTFQLGITLARGSAESLPDTEPIDLVVPGVGMYGLGSAQNPPEMQSAEKKMPK